MKRLKMLPVLGLLTALYLSTLGLTAHAQDYPRRRTLGARG